MPDKNSQRITVPSDKTAPIPRQPDSETYYLHCSAGFRAAKVSDDTWQIEPFLSDGVPSASGFLSRAELQVFIQRTGLMAIAFQSTRWRGGNYSSHWIPLIPKRQVHARGPSDLWGNISTRLRNTRMGSRPNELTNPSLENVGEIFDDRTPMEALAYSISLSLRAMDISIEKLASDEREHNFK